MNKPINKSAWLDGIAKPLRIGEANMPKPGPDDIIVKNHAIALNPADHMQYSTGMVIGSWPKVLGSDVAGEVYDIGSNVARFKTGDRVTGMAQGLLRGTAEDGAFSLYSRVPAGTAAVIPAHVAHRDAAVLGMAVATAACGLHKEEQLGLPLPEINPKATDKVMIVYGASSSIGSMTVQLATAAGIRVIAIASAKNFDLCRQCGATDTFDYRSSTIVDDAVDAVRKDEFVGIFESISTEQSYKINLSILEKLGGGRMACAQPPPKDLPTNVHAKWMMAMGDHSFPVFDGFVTEALKNGQLKCLPPPMVVGQGLESLQKAVETLQAGVSGQKVVVEL